MAFTFLKLNFKLLMMTCVIFGAVFSISAQTVTVDPAFSPVLQDFGSSGNGFPTVYTSIVQPDGKILIGGSFRRANQTTVTTAACLNSDGSFDGAFQSQIVDAGIGDLEIQPNGKIIGGGTFEITATNPSNNQSVTFKNLARLNADGSFDFGFTGNALEYSDNIVLLPDGKIVVGNSQFAATNPGGILVNRCNANGTLDATLATIEDFGIEAVELQPDGKIVIAGEINFVNGVFKKRIARLDASGTLDSSFDAADTLNGSIFDIAIVKRVYAAFRRRLQSKNVPRFSPFFELFAARIKSKKWELVSNYF